MKKNFELFNKRIIKGLKLDYGIETAMLTPLFLGADMNARLFKAQTLKGEAYFVKLKKHSFDIGLSVMNLLYESGIQQILPPLPTLNGQPSKPIEGYVMVVYPFIEGEDGFHKKLSENQWITFGEALRQIHEFHIPEDVKSLIRNEDYSSKFRKNVRSLYTHIEKGITGDGVTKEIISFMDKNRDKINKLIIHAENLSSDVKALSAELVLCHSDIHGGNVLIDENGRFFLIDWDDPILAPKERDLMFIGGGVCNVWNNPDEEKLFYTGYGETKINKKLLAYYRCERIVVDISEFGDELILKKESHLNRSEMLRSFLEMFAPHGVVDIAFRTVNNL